MDQTVELSKWERRKIKRKRRRKRFRRILLLGLVAFYLFGTQPGEETMDRLRQIDGDDLAYTLSQVQIWFKEIFPGLRTKIGDFLNYIANFL